MLSATTDASVGRWDPSHRTARENTSCPLPLPCFAKSRTQVSCCHGVVYHSNKPRSEGSGPHPFEQGFTVVFTKEANSFNVLRSFCLQTPGQPDSFEWSGDQVRRPNPRSLRRGPRIAVWDCIALHIRRAMPLPGRYVKHVQRFVSGQEEVKPRSSRVLLVLPMAVMTMKC